MRVVRDEGDAVVGQVDLRRGQMISQAVPVIAVRRSPTAANKVAFAGLPRRSGGAQLSRGEVMFEYVQRPLSPPVDPTKQAFRLITVANNGFQDWFGPHDARVYRFNLA